MESGEVQFGQYQGLGKGLRIVLSKGECESQRWVTDVLVTVLQWSYYCMRGLGCTCVCVCVCVFARACLFGINNQYKYMYV